jgi:hypothetical protein
MSVKSLDHTFVHWGAQGISTESPVSNLTPYSLVIVPFAHILRVEEQATKAGRALFVASFG